MGGRFIGFRSNKQALITLADEKTEQQDEHIYYVKEKFIILTHYVHVQGIVCLLKIDVRLQLIVQIFIHGLQLMIAYSSS